LFHTLTLRRFHVSCRHMNVCTHTRKPAKYPDKSDFMTSPQNSLDSGFKHADAHGVLGRAWNCSACAPGSDPVFSKHYQMLTPDILTLLHLDGPSLRVSTPISFDHMKDVKIKWLYHTHRVWKLQKITLLSIQKNTLPCTCSLYNTKLSSVRPAWHSVILL
jgi:hypothetical protein